MGDLILGIILKLLLLVGEVTLYMYPVDVRWQCWTSLWPGGVHVQCYLTNEKKQLEYNA